MIQYELFKNLKVGKNESQYHPRVKQFGTQSSKAIEEDISMCCTATRGDIQLVFTAMAEKMIDYMLKGYSVHIKELGTFSIILKASSPIKKDDEAVNSVVTVKSIKFSPEKQFMEQLRHKAEFSFIRANKNHNPFSSPEKENHTADKIITGYINENGFITRSIIQNILHITRYKAYKHIRRMKDEGKIIHINCDDSFPVYTLPGRE